MHGHGVKSAGVAIVMMIFMIARGLAQTQGAPQLAITVTDESGAAVPDASITLTKGNESRSFTSNARGVVDVPELGVGEWTLVAKGAGFAQRERPVIHQGVPQEVTVVLEVAPIKQDIFVEVPEETPSPVRLDASAASGSYLNVPVRDLPFNLTVIDQAYIRERGVTNVVDALELVSGVTTWADTGYIPGVDIRGMSTTDAGIYIAQEGIVQNSVPQAFRNMDSFFVESIDVLKGPSSFSYGSGVAGASINMRAKTPRRQLSIDSLFAYESFGRTRIGLDVNAPITKNLAGRILLSANEGGTNVQRTQSSGNAMHASLLWTPVKQLTILARGQYWTDSLSTYFSTPLPNRRVDPNVDYIEVAANTFLDPRTRTLNYNMNDPQNDVKNRRGTLTADLDLSHGWRLQNNFYAATLSQDTLNNESISFNQTSLLVTPANYFFNYKRDWLWGNDLNIRNTFVFWGGRSLSFTIGGKMERNNQVRHAADTSAGVNPAPPAMNYLNPIPFDPLYRYVMRSRDIDTNYDTGYFEAAFRFTPKLTVSGGARWDHISNSVLMISANTRNTVSFHPVTGRYALTYQLRPTVTLYVGHTNAVQPAGNTANNAGATALVGITQTQAQFATQPSNSWEGGVKASTWRGRVEGTASYFHMKKENIITQELVDNILVLERAGKIKSEGIDTQFIASPFRRFSLQGDFVWNNARYLVFHTVDTVNNVEIDRSGNWLPRVPAVIWAVTPIVHLGPIRGSLSFRTRGASWSDNNNTQRLSPSTVINANISVQLAKSIMVTLTGRNLTDELVMNRGGIVSGASSGRFGLPRNYGIQITKKWIGE